MRRVNTPKKVVKKSGWKLPQQSSARKRRATDVTKKCVFWGEILYITSVSNLAVKF